MIMKRFKKYCLSALVCVTTLLSAGCGYHVGTFSHPQLKSIGIPPVINETMSYNVSAEMRNLLAEQFMLDGSLKVKHAKKADCLIYVKVTGVSFAEVTERSFDEEDELFVADEWRATVNAEFSVILPGRKKPLISSRSVSGSANFQAPGDMDANRRRGIQQACREAARSIVEFTTEAW